MMMVGIKPVPDSLGRVNKLEVIPLEELGRPRVDVVVNCSGVFRDLFVNQMLLLDRCVGRRGGLWAVAAATKMCQGCCGTALRLWAPWGPADWLNLLPHPAHTHPHTGHAGPSSWPLSWTSRWR
jgi:hypothetical protein